MNTILHNRPRRARLLCYWLVTILFHTNLCYAQYENVWIFGINAGLDFNGAVPVPIVSNMGPYPPTFGEASASICDANGALLFYTEGSRVWNRQHALMPNGNNLTPIASVNAFTPTSSTTQGTIIIPIPRQPERYYIFSLTSAEQYTAGDESRLYYSIVDMRLNGGLGDVVAGAKGILLDSNLTERMTAVAGDRCNIWLLTVSQANELKAFEISSAGISNTPVLSNITIGSGGRGSIEASAGCIAVSPDRHKIAITCLAGSDNSFALFDFDPATGMASREQVLSGMDCYGACFSSDNTKLYVNFDASNSIHQFDLTAGSLGNIINSRTRIAENVYIAHLKLAPNGKIYFKHRTTAYLSVINAPDQPGLSCQPQENAVLLLPGYVFFGLPNVVPVLNDTQYNSSRKYSIECEGQVALIPTDASGRDYVWNDGSTAISRSVARQGTYWVSYNTPCDYTDTFEVVVLPVHYGITDVMCSNEEYDFNGRLLNSPGTYRDTLVTANGCDSVVTLNLVVLTSPEINILVEQETYLCIGDTILCKATGARSYEWYGNGHSLGKSDREYINLAHLSNKVFVMGQADNDCRDTAEIVIGANACCELFIPNAFSPNGDGSNDVFAPVPHGNIRGYSIEIFNRWGARVFTAVNIHKGWDGTLQGKPADGGVYFYHISIECLGGKQALIKKGDVLLVR